MVIDVSKECNNNMQIVIGHRGENGATVIEFEFSAWKREFGAGSLGLAARLPRQVNPYVVALETEGTVSKWTVSSYDTQINGQGAAQVVYIVDGVVKKSQLYRTYILDSIEGSVPTPPDPYESYIEQMMEIAADTYMNAQSAADSATNAAGSAGDAAGSARDASGYADNAAGSARDASGYANAASGSATAAETDALKAEGFAVGEQGGEAVGTGSPYYHNNAEYYSDQAGSSATSASGSATSAETNALKAEGYAVGKQNGTDVGDTSPYYHNNAEYYATEAAASAQAAAESARTLVIDPTLTHSGQAADAKVTGDELANVKSDLRNKASVIISSASGSIAHFEDGSESDAVDVVAHINPVQDLHGYDNPWPAGGGKNKCYEAESELFCPANGGAIYQNQGSKTAYAEVANNTDYVISFSAEPPRHSAFGFTEKPAVGVVGTPITISTISATAYSFNSGNYNYIGFYYLQPGGTYTGGNVQIEQGTTPTSYSPYSNICPISGFTEMNVVRTGKNVGILSEATLLTVYNATYTYANNGIVVTSTGSYGRTDFEFPVKKGNTYTISFSGMKTDGALNVYLGVPTSYNKYGAVQLLSTMSLTSKTITVEEDILSVRIYPNGNGNSVTVENFMVEEGTTATPYEPYTGQTYPVTFPSEASTVYGGYVDPVKGKLVVDRAAQSISDLEFIYQSQYPRFYTSAIQNIIDKNKISQTICEALPYTGSTSVPNRLNVAGSGNMFITSDLYTSTAALNAGIGTALICYPLAEPITYDITPQQIALLLGVNNVWHNANGDTNVTYAADTKLFIEQLTKPTEDDMTANAAIQSGKFFMVGNRLFLSTSVIASGDTIKPGTNCTEMSLADALNNI